jgi:hypothetical protein
MNREQRKAAVVAYKKRAPVAGIFALMCQATGRRWVGQAADLDTIQNRLWFTLRQGACPHAALQVAWNAHGDGAFTFEVIERLDEEELGYVRDRLLKDRLSHWRSALAAEVI